MPAPAFPSERAFGLLAVLARAAVSAELDGRHIARAYEQDSGERIAGGAVYELLDEMVAAQWVEMREEQDAGRKRWYRITPRGVEMLQRARGATPE